MTQVALPEIIIRPAQPVDLEAASALCRRSKAHWGYDAAFMEACRDELTLRPEQLDTDYIALAFAEEQMVGVAHVEIAAGYAELEKLFVEPGIIGSGIGRKLFEWAVRIAVEKGAPEMHVTADPQATGFYERIGFVRVGEEPSGSIPGRMLATYTMDLPRG